MDGLIAQYAAGPRSEPNYSIHYATIMASKDPVAIDSIALRQIEEWRAKEKLPPLKEAAGYLPMAVQYGLGKTDPRQIEIRSVGR
jgi:uncharacterized Fe-S center protein